MCLSIYRYYTRVYIHADIIYVYVCCLSLNVCLNFGVL